MLRSILFTALIAFSASAGAQGFNYDYFSVGYTRVDFDSSFFGASADGNGLGVAGSYGLNENVFVFGSFQNAEVDIDAFAVEGDIETYDAGIGYRLPLSDTMDFYGKLSYEYMDLDGFDDNGYGLAIGIRAKASDAVELNASIEHFDIGDIGDETSLGLGALYSVSENIDVGLSGNWGDDVSQYTLSGRFYFGN